MPKGFKHGLRYTPEYIAWINMRQRCNNPHGHDAHYYKNISHCLEWDDPVQFITDMGKRPSLNHQIDRIDNTKGYSKDNCRWVEKAPQMRNTRIAKWWFVHGVRYSSLSEAADALGVTVSRIKAWCEGRTDGGYSYPPKSNCWSEKKYD
jgi:hypothetical protein